MTCRPRPWDGQRVAPVVPPAGTVGRGDGAERRGGGHWSRLRGQSVSPHPGSGRVAELAPRLGPRGRGEGLLLGRGEDPAGQAAGRRRPDRLTTATSRTSSSSYLPQTPAVADLDRSSHEEATRYEIPLVKVDGGPYFPGERCDSPWVKHTPITFEEEWRGPSDTGWLCESTTSTEGEPTERWCMTTGWEQGFVMCLSGNVDRWLRGWNRNE